MDRIKIKFRYNAEKGLAMLEYLLGLVGGKYNQMALLKLAFFADRYHVRNYSRPVSMDEYYALKLGPIPSNLKDILDLQNYYPEDFFFPGDYKIELKSADIDTSQFSKSDIEAMKFSFEHFAALGARDEFFLANLTHAYPEWDKYSLRFETSKLGREDMDYADFLLNADVNHPDFRKLAFVDPFRPLSESEQEEILSEMQERTLAFA
ncbi:MAG: SocA family protein [Ignavibacteriales bacterium]|nr:SocA family protein [Ignavibacteriales bacterium]